MMMASPTEECTGKLISKKKNKEKSITAKNSTMPNSLFGSGSNPSELPSFPTDRTSTSSSDGKYVMGLKNHSTTAEVTSSPVKERSKKKSGSESSTGGGQGSLSNSTHGDNRRNQLQNRSGRGFSSGSSDGEDERVKEEKHRVSSKMKGTKLAKPSPLESDDEATDSADEGNSGEEERGRIRRRRRGEISGGMLGLRQSDRSSRKDSSESTNSATSPVLNSTLSTIFVESALPKEPMAGPVNMSVGYGAAESIPPPSVFDKTPTQSPLGTPTMDSPKPESDGQQSPGTPIPISPPSAEATEDPSSVAAPPTNATPSGVPLNPIQQSPSIQATSFNLPFENWVYQAQAAAVYSPFPLSSSHPGSVATTPVAVESGPYLRTGAPVFLRGTVCQESEGVLIVSVQWRNKMFSGSLIDMNQHEWAPPRLAGDFDEPLTHLKDLCKQQEKRDSESQQVNVDVEEDDSTKDTTSGSDKMDSSTRDEEPSSTSAVLSSSTESKSDKVDGKAEPRSKLDKKEEEEEEEKQTPMETDERTRPKLPRNLSLESEPGDMEIVENESSSNPQSQSHSPIMSPNKTKLGAAKVSVDSVYSDISDVSDNEGGSSNAKDKKELSGQLSKTSVGVGLNGVSQVTPFIASDPPSQSSGGAKPKKIPATEEIQHTLPSFSAINASSTPSHDVKDKKQDGRVKAKTSGDKNSSDSSASLLRSNLLSSYPSTSTTGSVTVSTPNQNHRHSFASNASGSNSNFTTLVNTAMTNQQPLNTTAGSDHHKGHSSSESSPSLVKKASNFSIESLNSRGSTEGKDPKLTHSLHPTSFKSRDIRGRSTSPTRKKSTKEPSALPPFNVAGLVQQEGGKPTLDYVPGQHTFSKSADDSDSSGSGSILSTHRRKKPHNRRGAEPLTGLNDAKEESSLKAPETPSLGPIGIHNFNLKIQPISPGADYPAQQQHMPSSITKDGLTAPACVSTASSIGPTQPVRSPAARVASPYPTTVGEAMGLLPTGSGAFKEGSTPSLGPVPKTHREMEKGENESNLKEPHPERRHTGSSSSPSSVSSTSIPGISLGMPAPVYHALSRVPQGVIQTPPQGRGEATKHDQYKRRSPVPSEMMRPDRDQNQNPRKRKNNSPSDHGKHSSEQEESTNPDAAQRSQHPGHSFPGQHPVPQAQGFPPFVQENEKMDSLFPPDFNYDPNLPMTIQYQFLSFVNQKKQAQKKEYEDQLKDLNQKDREEIDRHHHVAHFSSRSQHQPRSQKRQRLGDHVITQPAPLQMPHRSPPAITKDPSGKQKKSSHHQHRMGLHMDHSSEERHSASSHPQPHVNIKTEPLDIPRHSSHKPASANIPKQSHPHPGHRSQPLQGSSTSSKQSSQKTTQPQPRTSKPDQTFIKTEAGSEQQHVLAGPGVPGWPTGVIPVVQPGGYHYSMFPSVQSLQGKEAKPKEHKDHKDVTSGSQHTAFHTQPIPTPIVALPAGSQGWNTAPFMHPHSNIVQSGVSHAEKTSRQEHSSAAVTTTTSVITGKNAPTEVRIHRPPQSSPSSSSKKSSAFQGDGGGDRRSGIHKLHSSHVDGQHGSRPPSTNSVRRMEGGSSGQRSGVYSSQSEGEGGRRSINHPHSHAHSTSSSTTSSSSSTQQSSGQSSSSRSHKSTDHLSSTQQLQAQAAVAAAAHQMNLQQQQQQPSLSSPLQGIQLRQGVPIVPNWEEWMRLQEMMQKGGAAELHAWQQQMHILAQAQAQAQGVPMLPVDPNVLVAIQQQQHHHQQQQQHQTAEQTANTLQNLHLLQAAAAGGNMIQLMHPMAGPHPAMAAAAAGLYDPAAFGGAAMLPFHIAAATTQKRDS